jgi:hypothetical protein
MAAEDTAANPARAAAVSNSWGGSEDNTILPADSHFNHPGVAITASSGDSGYGLSWPASSQFVTGVGGTTLTPAPGARGWTEAAWSGSGSGCSAFEPPLAWQPHPGGCAKRTVADVSAVADPATGVAVFHTDGSNPAASGWMVFGGTSASAPIVAGVYALKGHAGGFDPFAQLAPFFDVTSGANGSCGSYLCQAGPGYDGPTGLGSPDGGSSAQATPAPPPSRSRPPVTSAAAPPTLTLRRAAGFARKALAKVFGRSFKHRRGFRVSCRRKSRVVAVCAVSWRSGSSFYSGSVTVTSTVVASGRVVQQVTYTVSRKGGGCRGSKRCRTAGHVTLS